MTEPMNPGQYMAPECLIGVNLAQEPTQSCKDAAEKAEEVARVSYGRLLAILAAQDGDIESVEDFLADAFLQALRTWPERGIPRNPEAWVLTVARKRRLDLRRSASHRLSNPIDESLQNAAFSVAPELESDSIPDRRLALLFVCAHPAIDPAVRTPLMLQTVLGFDADRIASAFATPARTMAQRLVRAKRRIRDSRIPFLVPNCNQLADRLPPVLEAIYGAYAIDFPLVAGMSPRISLATEAHFLSTTLAEFIPDDPEVLGLAALISLSHSREPSRGSAEVFVPLDEQDPSLWSLPLIATGERYLHRARILGRIGRFQIEAAIQSAHCARAITGVTDWRALHTLHAALLSVAPTLGARVAHAAAVGRVEGPIEGLALLDSISEEAAQRFQPAWATRARLLAEAGQVDEALLAYDRAISLTTELGPRHYLERQRRQLLTAGLSSQPRAT